METDSFRRVGTHQRIFSFKQTAISIRAELYQLLQMVRGFGRLTIDQRVLEQIDFLEIQIGRELANVEVLTAELLLVLKQKKEVVYKENKLLQQVKNKITEAESALLLVKLNINSCLYL